MVLCQAAPTELQCFGFTCCYKQDAPKELRCVIKSNVAVDRRRPPSGKESIVENIRI